MLEGDFEGPELYAAGVDKVVPVSSARVAESSKLLENVFRSINIAQLLIHHPRRLRKKNTKRTRRAGAGMVPGILGESVQAPWPLPPPSRQFSSLLRSNSGRLLRLSRMRIYSQRRNYSRKYSWPGVEEGILVESYSLPCRAAERDPRGPGSPSVSSEAEGTLDAGALEEPRRTLAGTQRSIQSGVPIGR